MLCESHQRHRTHPQLSPCPVQDCAIIKLSPGAGRTPAQRRNTESISVVWRHFAVSPPFLFRNPCQTPNVSVLTRRGSFFLLCMLRCPYRSSLQSSVPFSPPAQRARSLSSTRHCWVHFPCAPPSGPPKSIQNTPVAAARARRASPCPTDTQHRFAHTTGPSGQVRGCAPTCTAPLPIPITSPLGGSWGPPGGR